MSGQAEFDFNGATGGSPGMGMPAEGDEGGAEVGGSPEADWPHVATEGGGPLRRLMDRNFLQYASYVICDRAIPALEDGLKPVQRRILYSLFEKDDGRFIKVATVVGHCMQYHPHGDASITDALVHLTTKGYLIEGQGNFGNPLTGDPAAASRYIECRLTDLARNELFDKDLMEFVPSYDGRSKEPAGLPSKLPLLLMMGAEGIAVGISTRVLPHNFRELLEAQIAVLRKRPFDLWPDFPQGGLMDASEYERGRGRVRVRAVIEPRGDGKLVIRELPFGVTTESLIASIEEAARSNKVPVKTISDFTAEQVEIELTLLPEANAERAIQALYAFTACEGTVTSHLVVLHANRPVELDVHAVLEENTRQLVDVLDRQLKLRRHKLLEEIHAKTLVRIFIENRIYKRIEECRTQAAIVKAVLDGVAPFLDQLRRDVTQEDVDALLELRIRRISRFDIERNRKEIASLSAEVAKVERDLGGLVAYTIRYLQGMLRQYGDRYERRTRIASFGAVKVRDLTSRELRIQFDEEKGYLGCEVAGRLVLECSSYDRLMLFWGDGRYKVVAPPDKMFTDRNLVFCGRTERDRVMTVVYTLDRFSYLKRFAVGGAVLNREYRYVPEGARVLLFADDQPESVYVKYKPAKGQRIHQQVFSTRDVPVRGVKARGNQMTAKAIERAAGRRPRWWEEDATRPRGVLL